MKKSLQLLLSLSYALSFTACTVNGDDDDDTGANTDVTAGNTDTDATMTGSMSTTAADDTAGETPADDTAGETPADDTAADTGSGEMACVHTCAADADCLAMGTDIGLICTDTHCVPSDPPDPCTDDAACIAMFSGWSFTPCTMGGGECSAAMQVCVDLGDGTGGCAYPAEGGAVDCATLTFDEVDATNLDDGTAVTVCGNGRAYCDMDADPAFCNQLCTEDAHCGTLTCNTDTGACECTEDAQCGDGNTCVEGACHVPGCSSDEDCTNPFDGGTIACQ